MKLKNSDLTPTLFLVSNQNTESVPLPFSVPFLIILAASYTCLSIHLLSLIWFSPKFNHFQIHLNKESTLHLSSCTETKSTPCELNPRMTFAARCKGKTPLMGEGKLTSQWHLVMRKSTEMMQPTCDARWRQQRPRQSTDIRSAWSKTRETMRCLTRAGSGNNLIWTSSEPGGWEGDWGRGMDCKKWVKRRFSQQDFYRRSLS